MGKIGDVYAEKCCAHLSMSDLKSKIRSVRKEYIREKEKEHSQGEINDLTSRIDVLGQILKLFPE